MKNLIIIIFLLAYVNIVNGQEAPEGLFINSKAPDFKAKNQNGIIVHLKDTLKKQTVVLIFYRGYWCPYCQRELKRFADSLSFIKAKGATVIAISSESYINTLKTNEKSKSGFSIISDSALKIMKAYKVNYAVPQTTIDQYRNSGIDLLKINGINGGYLPIPAVYIIDKTSNIIYRYFDNNYKLRPSVKEILKNL